VGTRARAILGFILAPLAPFVLLRVIQTVGDVDTRLGVDRGGFIHCAYFWTLLIAVPAWRLFTKHTAFRVPHALGVGGLVGFMVWATLPVVPLPACVGLGAFAGIVFWLIAQARRAT
jgi:hypothetical protein